MTSTTKPNRRSSVDNKISRNLASCLMAFITSVVMIPGMTTYLPFKLADQIALPILLFPFIWIGLFIYSYLSKKSWHAWAVMLVITISHALLSYLALSGGL
ncbi:hypothetical protein [Parashewanella tropica]|uniref:hypothetical protein n=1 Tax=Parashewanella tropica TaxID=2547970 RepID=UPI001FEB8DDD|nr:hypothetical protein [Parashewanella tropica]